MIWGQFWKVLEGAFLRESLVISEQSSLIQSSIFQNLFEPTHYWIIHFQYYCLDIQRAVAFLTRTAFFIHLVGKVCLILMSIEEWFLNLTSFMVQVFMTRSKLTIQNGAITEIRSTRSFDVIRALSIRVFFNLYLTNLLCKMYCKCSIYLSILPFFLFAIVIFLFLGKFLPTCLMMFYPENDHLICIECIEAFADHVYVSWSKGAFRILILLISWIIYLFDL